MGKESGCARRRGASRAIHDGVLHKEMGACIKDFDLKLSDLGLGWFGLI